MMSNLIRTCNSSCITISLSSIPCSCSALRPRLYIAYKSIPRLILVLPYIACWSDSELLHRRYREKKFNALVHLFARWRKMFAVWTSLWRSQEVTGGESQHHTMSICSLHIATTDVWWGLWKRSWMSSSGGRSLRISQWESTTMSVVSVDCLTVWRLYLSLSSPLPVQMIPCSNIVLRQSCFQSIRLLCTVLLHKYRISFTLY